MKLLKLFFFAVLFAVGTQASAADSKSPAFVADTNVQKLAKAYAQDAVDMASEQFGVKLDWSDASIALVEKALAKIHASYVSTKPQPNREQVMSFAKGYGSYIGEVYRRNHGGEWGIVSLEGQKFPGLRTASGKLVWPWGRASNRIVNGDEDNIVFYYGLLLEK